MPRWVWVITTIFYLFVALALMEPIVAKAKAKEVQIRAQLDRELICGPFQTMSR